jgi:hypothetical protein
MRGALELDLGFPTAGDVANGGHDQQLLARVHRAQTDLYRHLSAVLASGVQVQSQTHGPGDWLTQAMLPVRLVTRPVALGDERFDRLSQHLVELIARHTERSRIGERCPPCQIEAVDAIGHGVQDQVACGQRGFPAVLTCRRMWLHHVEAWLGCNSLSWTPVGD